MNCWQIEYLDSPPLGRDWGWVLGEWAALQTPSAAVGWRDRGFQSSPARQDSAWVRSGRGIHKSALPARRRETATAPSLRASPWRGLSSARAGRKAAPSAVPMPRWIPRRRSPSAAPLVAASRHCHEETAVRLVPTLLATAMTTRIEKRFVGWNSW